MQAFLARLNDGQLKKSYFFLIGLAPQALNYWNDNDYLPKGHQIMAMKEPPHPGRSVRYDCLKALGLSVTEGAEVLGVSRQALNNLVNCKAGISPEMAVRLDKAFGGTPETWLSLQTAYDLAQAKKNSGAIAVRRYVPATRVHDEPRLS